ncbi:MAG: hypothetical protein HY543_01565, partial [Deltaproteobacteria bacterium]|nr:hypothetical protein [Deltaproteobacteria bacterium]
MQTSGRKIGVIIGCTLVCFLLTSLTIRWYHQQCPARVSVPAEAFPAQAALVDWQSAEAVVQWTRKYEVTCQTCHTAFPRLNAFGEQFARNGYQMPETEDGEEKATKVSEETFIQRVGNMLGFRISFTPVEVTTKAITINGQGKLRYNFGVGNWLQLFVAGPIFKNASIFTEFEIPGQNPTAYSASDIAHINWFTLGYHNLFRTSWLNIRTGKLSMRNWVAQTGRLRMIPNINVAATRIRPSEGVAAAIA